MSTASAVVYTLITVTYGGTVGHSGGFKSLHDCKEASSLALTGLTIEDEKKLDDDYAASVKKWEEHLAELPEKEQLEQEQLRQNTYVSGPFNENEGESVEFVRGQEIMKYATDDKIAECVIEE